MSPRNGLDPRGASNVLAALLEYVSTHGATVLISSHLVHEQERVCDWIGVMDAGRLVAEMPMHAFPQRHQASAHCRSACARVSNTLRDSRAPGRRLVARRNGSFATGAMT
jgi:ABC-type multidrug transport system ATPase subunit